MGNGMNKVLPGLYVGNIRDAKDEQQLRSNEITHIISIHDNARELHEDKEYLCIQASDSPGQNLSQFFSRCNDFIHRARVKGGKVLIHCLAGVSRSVTIAVAYIMSITTLSSREALKVVRSAREMANPNVGFQKQLNQFEYHKLNEERRRMRETFPDINFEEDENECRKVLVIYHNTPRVKEACICRRNLQLPSSPQHSPRRSRSPHPPPSPVRSRSPLPSSSRLQSQSPHPPSPMQSRSPLPPSSPVRSRSPLPPSSPVQSQSPLPPSSPVRSWSQRQPSSPVRSWSMHVPSSPSRSRQLRSSSLMSTESPQAPSSPSHNHSSQLVHSPMHNGISEPPPSPRRSCSPFMRIFSRSS